MKTMTLIRTGMDRIVIFIKRWLYQSYTLHRLPYAHLSHTQTPLPATQASPVQSPDAIHQIMTGLKYHELNHKTITH